MAFSRKLGLARRDFLVGVVIWASGLYDGIQIAFGIGADFCVDLVRHFWMLTQVFTRIVLALADFLAFVAVPGTRFLNQLEVGTHFNDFAFAGDTFAI